MFPATRVVLTWRQKKSATVSINASCGASGENILMRFPVVKMTHKVTSYYHYKAVHLVFMLTTRYSVHDSLLQD